MVAKIKSGKSLKGALSYNEHKVSKGKALLLDAIGYAKEAGELTFEEKLFRLLDLASRNQRVRTNTIHVSLNFVIGEDLDADQLLSIARRYMTGIGFGAQPFLVYQHFDAGHPHIHILSTNIDRDGKRISMHDLGKTKSEHARKAIEDEFGLQKAEGTSLAVQETIEPVIYGMVDSKRAIEQVVRLVTDRYRFTSVPELNAVLQQFNVLADRGSKSSVMNKNQGLRYWITDDKGQKLGVPIKASSLKGKPTMKLLEPRFLLNGTLRRAEKDSVREKVEKALGRSKTLLQFQSELKKMDVHSIIRRTEAGMIYGFTVVDNQLKTVFNGSDLGKEYAASAIALRFMAQNGSPDQIEKHKLHQPKLMPTAPDNSEGLLNILFAPTVDDPASPAAFQRKKKKKRKLNL